MRSGWLILAVVTCVVFGSTVNRCLTCGAPNPAQSAARPPATLRGTPFVSKAADPPVPAPATNADAPADGAPDDVRRTLPPLPKKDATPAGDGRFLALTFDTIANYEYRLPDFGKSTDGGSTGQIPESMMKLSGREISIQGYMIPIRVEGESVLEFVLVRNQFACCYGVIPRMNEWLHVTMAPGKTAPYAVDIPITIYGRLDVGEVWENGVVMSLYRLECSNVTEPPLFK